MKYHIFPGTSDLGMKVADALLTKISPNELIMSARSTEKLNDYRAKGVEVRYADYNDEQTLIDAFKKDEIIFLIPSTSKTEIRTIEITKAINAMKQKSVSHVILSSILGVKHGLAMNFVMAPFYLYAESFLKHSGIPSTIIRNSYYADVILNEKEQVLKQPAGNGKTSYLAKTEVAEAIATVMLNKALQNTTYTLTDTQTHDFYDIAKMLTQLRGETYTYEPATPEAYYEILKKTYNTPDSIAEILLSLYNASALGDDDIVTDDFFKIMEREPTPLFEVLLKMSKERSHVK